MRCKKHYPQDHTSSLGVCASCLRDRLFALVAAQAHQAQLLVASPPPPPPPLLFPRSVSPYVSRRKSQGPPDPHPLFYSTPQVGPDPHPHFYSTPQVGPDLLPPDPKKKHRRSFLLSGLFRSRSEKLDPRPSWISSFIRHRPSAVARGMSPDPDAAEEDCRRTPAQGGGRKGGHARNSSSSGMAFCMSPLVWASPRRQWSNHHPPDSEGSRPRNLSVAASFCANRSRKLADLGRFAPKH